MRNSNLLSIAVLLGLTIPIPAADLRVPDDYANLQDAIDAAATGDRILLSPGDYETPLYITSFQITGKQLSIEAAVPDQPPRLVGDFGAIYIVDSDVQLRHLEFAFSGTFAAVDASNSTVVVADCELWHYGRLIYNEDGWNGGMRFTNCPSVAITRCISHGRDGEADPYPGGSPGGGQSGLEMENCDRVWLTDCTFEGGDGASSYPQHGQPIYGGTGGHGAILNGCPDVVIIDSSFTGGGGDPAGMGLVLENNTAARMNADSTASSTSVDGTSTLVTLLESANPAWEMYR